MKIVAVNYNFTPTWLLNSEFDYIIYDRSDSKEYLKDFPQERIVYTENRGNVDYDKLTYIVENYHDLPEAFILTKSNLFKYITKAEFEGVKENRSFTPLLTRNHETRMPVAFYDVHGMYWEINNSWYLNEVPARFQSWGAWAMEFGLPNPEYIPFAPGGNYIVTKERIHRRPRSYYEKMRSTLPYTQLPGEAQLVERSYFFLWR